MSSSSTTKNYPRPGDAEQARCDILLKRNAEIELAVDAIMQDIFRDWETTGCLRDVTFSDYASVMPKLAQRLKDLGWIAGRHYGTVCGGNDGRLAFASVYTSAPGSI